MTATDLQALIDSGRAWRSAGSVGRAAMAAIESGLCVLGVVVRLPIWRKPTGEMVQTIRGPQAVYSAIRDAAIQALGRAEAAE